MWTDMRVHLALFTASVGCSYRALSSVSHLIPAPSREFGSRGTLGPCCGPAACRGQRQGRGVQPARALVTEGGWVSATYQPLEPAPRPLSAGAAPGVAVAAWGAAAVSPVPLSPRTHLHRTVEAGLRHGGGPLSALDYSGSKNSADGKVFWNPEGTELADPFLKRRTGLTRFSAPVGSVSSAAVVTAPSVSEPSSSRHPHLPWQGGGREGRPGLAPVQVRPHLLQEEPWEGRAVS